MSRVIAMVACGFTLAACSASLPSMDFFKSSPATEALGIESEPPGAEAKTSPGQSCRTPCELTVQAGGELSVTLALNGYQPQTVSLREAEGTGSWRRIRVYVELQPGAAAVGEQDRLRRRSRPLWPCAAGAARPHGRAADGDRVAAPPPTPAPSAAGRACGAASRHRPRPISLADAIATGPGLVATGARSAAPSPRPRRRDALADIRQNSHIRVAEKARAVCARCC